jgi:hypothetical protein
MIHSRTVVKLNVTSILIALGTVFSQQLPGSANWQFTRWGMTMDEFRRAAPSTMEIRGSNPNCSGNRYTGFFSSDWIVDDLELKVCFAFANNGLERVRLTLKEPTLANAFKLKDLLQLKYGDPTPDNSLKHIGVLMLKWRTKSEIIVYDESINNAPGLMRNHVSVYYETLKKTGVDKL